MQDEIVGKVVTTVGLISNLDRLRLGHLAGTPSTDNLEAYQDFLRAIEYYRRFTKDDNAQARQWLDKAIALDPTRAALYYFKAQALVSKATIDPQTQKMVLAPGCAEAYQKYLELEPNGPYAADAKGVLSGAGIAIKTGKK
jgi:tetratricopeptide (TPR) repeat protein